MTRVLNWDGTNLPEEMRSLPPGRYVVELVDERVELTPDEEAGLQQAIASLDAGQGRRLEDARRRILTAAAKK